MTPPQSPVVGALMGLAAFGLYSCYDMTIKGIAGAGSNISSMQVLFCAGGFALPMVLAQLLLTGQGRNLLPVLPGWTAFRIVVTLLNGTLGAYAFTVLPLAECYAVFFLMPLLISGFAVPFLGEQMDLPRGIAIVAGLVGVAVALQPGVTPLNLGHLAAMASACLGACNYIVIRKTSGIERPGVMLLYPMAAQCVVLAVAMVWLWQPMSAGAVGMTFVMALQLLVGGLLILTAYRLAPVIVVSPMQYSQIIWAAVIGWLIFGEKIDRMTGLGIGIIIASGLFLLSRSGAQTAQVEPDLT
jgi:S-adenosylmethionine uptake transporter